MAAAKKPIEAFEDYSIGTGGVSTVAQANGIPFWGDSPDTWNTVYLAGQRLPGIASISGSAFDIRADRKTTPGESGEKVTTLGREPCDPEIIVKLWTREHLAAFVKIIKLFLPSTAGALGPPVDVVHPALAMFKVRSVRIMKCTFPEEKEKDVFEVKMKCREFVRGRGGTKPKTDTASIEKEGPGAVQKKVDSFHAPDVVNGNAPRTKQPDPAAILTNPASLFPGGV